MDAIAKMSDTTIDDIFNLVHIGYEHQNCEDSCVAQSYCKEAKSALYDLMLEVIGVDERIIELSGNSRFDQQVTSQVNGANDLRAEQRNKLKQLFNKKVS